jgi:glutamate-5-semialdehyde dehydrogenase
MDIAKQVLDIAAAARKASQELSSLSTSLKNKVLNQIADELLNSKDFLQKENEKDLKDAVKKGLSPALIDRLTLSDKVLSAMIEGIRG